MATPLIVLLHGAFMHPACLDPWCAHLEEQGYACEVAPWPHYDRPAEELRASPPRVLEITGIDEITDHYASRYDRVDQPLILLGHDLGGLVVQDLLARGIGDAGIAIAPWPAKGVGFDGVRKAWKPVLSEGRGAREIHHLSYDHFEIFYGNSLPPSQRRLIYDACAVPAPGQVFYDTAPGLFRDRAAVDFDADRAPLLFVAGGLDVTIPEQVVRDNRRAWDASPAVTTLQTWGDRSHWMVVEPGWQEIADFALTWIGIQTGLEPEAPPTGEEPSPVEAPSGSPPPADDPPSSPESLSHDD